MSTTTNGIMQTHGNITFKHDKQSLGSFNNMFTGRNNEHQSNIIIRKELNNSK